jgi:hypothetical protein
MKEHERRWHLGQSTKPEPPFPALFPARELLSNEHFSVNGTLIEAWAGRVVRRRK